MRSLREKLMAVASKPAAAQQQPKDKPDPFYCKVHRFPLDELHGIEWTTLEEIKACDPGFTGTSWDIKKLLFLDTETTGLSGGAGTVAFEIGLGYIENNCMVIRQYVMRDYSEEAAMLEDIAKLFSRFNTLVTFNGKTFDIPLLESRMIMHRIRLHISEYPHFDLLHACRRVYKLRLKRCSLSALEEAVLGEGRVDDLPGALVPQRYFDYIKTREFALLGDVLHHNLQDVKSLAALTGHLCAVYRQPEQLEYPQDLFGVAKTLQKGGKEQRARHCYRILGHSSMSSQAHLHLAASYKRDKDWNEALSVWQTMIANAEGGTLPYIELAKYYEHAVKDNQRALRYASAALSYALNASLLTGNDEAELLALRKRIARLRNKQNKVFYTTGGIE